MPYANNAGTRISWDEYGDGAPLLLIMGHRFSRRMWYPAVPALSEHYRVISFDNRGTGESDAPRGGFTIADMARDACVVLDAAGVTTAHIYGVSMGGLIAQEVALSAPERVRSLVLGCTAALSPDKRRPPRASYLQYWLPKSLNARLARSLLYGPAATTESIAADLAMLADDRSDRRGLVAQARAVAAYNCLDRVGTIDKPTLVLHGDHDRVISPDWGRELADAIPGARFVSLAGAGHNYLADVSDEANKLVLEFLAGV